MANVEGPAGGQPVGPGAAPRAGGDDQHVYNWTLAQLRALILNFAKILQNLEIYVKGLNSFSDGATNMLNFWTEMITAYPSNIVKDLPQYLKALEEMAKSLSDLEAKYPPPRTATQQKEIDNVKGYIDSMLQVFQKFASAGSSLPPPDNQYCAEIAKLSEFVLKGGHLTESQETDLASDFNNIEDDYHRAKTNSPLWLAVNAFQNNVTNGPLAQVQSAIMSANQKAAEYEGIVSAITGGMAKIVDRAYTTIQAIIQNMSPR